MKNIINKIQFSSLIKRGYLSYIAAIMTVIVLPVHVQYLPPFLIIWCLSWIVENYLLRNEKWNLKTPHKVLFLLFISYYVWQVVGLIYTSDTKQGLLNLFGRLSLILFPMVLIFPGEMIKGKIIMLTRAFAGSTFIYMIICFANSLFRSINLNDGVFNPHPIEYPWLNYFYSADLTISQHPSYVAMYVLLSAFICFESWFSSSIKIKHRIFWLISGSILLLSQYFISSRAGIFISLVLVPLYFLIKIKNSKYFRLQGILIIIVVICLLPVIIKNQRVDYLFGGFFNKQVSYERKQDPRFQIWESALNVSKQNLLLGVGIGDVRHELSQEYKRIGEDQMAKERFNAHNQFLEVLLENGIVGVTIFISIFLCMFYIAYIDKSLLYGFFILMIILFFMFETVLYRLAGVSFFSLFSFLLLHLNQKESSL
jgi:O-antigen ligase